MRELELEDLELDPVFEFTLYYGYTKNALKGYEGEVMPSIGITEVYLCPYHKVIEYLSLIDIDEKVPKEELFRKVETAITETFTESTPAETASGLPPGNIYHCHTKVPGYIITESKYGYHIILVTHTTLKTRALKVQQTLTRYLKSYGIYVDTWHQEIGIKRGRTIIRIFGKYADDPVVKVIKISKPYDPVIKELLKLYDTARWVRLWASLTQLQSPDSY